MEDANNNKSIIRAEEEMFVSDSAKIKAKVKKKKEEHPYALNFFYNLVCCSLYKSLFNRMVMLLNTATDHFS